MLKETMKHFEPKENAQDEWAGFKSYYVNGQKVIDLTSIDEEYEPVKLRYQDIERERIYGDKAKSTRF